MPEGMTCPKCGHVNTSYGVICQNCRCYMPGEKRKKGNK